MVSGGGYRACTGFFAPATCQMSCTYYFATLLHSNFNRPFCEKLFIPSVQTFAICDPIPLLVQLQAPVASLRALFGLKASRSSLENTQAFPNAPNAKSVVRVFLYRQIRVEINGKRVSRTIALGEGTLRTLTPNLSLSSALSDDVLESLDWEGEVKCNKDVTIGGFSLDWLIVKVTLSFILAKMSMTNQSFKLLFFYFLFSFDTNET
jgi:hypothetical protein